MTPTIDDRHPARRSRFWAQPISRFARRRGSAATQPTPVVLPLPQAGLQDDGEAFLRRLREAGL